MRTVWSAKPMAKNRERCSPTGIVPKLIHTTSADISFLSVYSFSCPDYKERERKREREREREREEEREKERERERGRERERERERKRERDKNGQ